MRKQYVRLANILLLVSLIFMGVVSGATCYCNSCTSCTADLNNPACTKVVLTQDIQLTSASQVCISNPPGFENKVFDCQGHAFKYSTPVFIQLPLIGISSLVLNSTITLGNISVGRKDVNGTIENCMFINVQRPIGLYTNNISVINTTIINGSIGFIAYSPLNTSIINTTYESPEGDVIYAAQNPTSSLISSTFIKKYAFYVKNLYIKGNDLITQINTDFPTLYKNIVWNLNLSTLTPTRLNAQYTLDVEFIRNVQFDNLTFLNYNGLVFPGLGMDNLKITNAKNLTLFFLYCNHLSIENVSGNSVGLSRVYYSTLKGLDLHSLIVADVSNTSFINISVVNGDGLIIASSWPSLNNQFINLTLINNSPLDFNMEAPSSVGYSNTLLTLSNNTFKNIKSNDGRPILVGAWNSSSFTGNYAEIFALMNNSNLTNIYVSASPTLHNDGVFLFGNNDRITNTAVSGCYRGLKLVVTNLLVNQSVLLNNTIGLDAAGSNVTVVSSKLLDNTKYGVLLGQLDDAIIKKSVIKDNREYDVFSPSSIFCKKTVLFVDDSLSGSEPLLIVNKSTAVANGRYSELMACGKGIVFNNLTIEGNTTLKNNGILLYGCSNTELVDIRANNDYYGLAMYGCNSTKVVNSSFSNEKHSGIVLNYDPFLALYCIQNIFDNVSTEHNGDYGMLFTPYTSYNSIDESKACFNKIGYFFQRETAGNSGSSNLGNVTDLGTNPGFSADAGICYLSLLKPVFVPPTPANNSIISSTSITLNATSSDPTLTNITLNLYNNTGLVKSVVCTSSPCSYSFTGLKLNENYYFNASACDAEKQCASTGTYTTYLSPTTCALVLVVKNHLNKPLYLDHLKIGGYEYDLHHILLLPYQKKKIVVEDNHFCKYLFKVAFLKMTLYFSDASNMTYDVTGEIALNS